MRKMKKFILLLSIYFTCSIFGVIAQPTKEQLIAAINTMATYASEVLLDESGKSKCDYNLIESKWYPYEEAWHTGQIILGLLESYKLTGNKNYLNAAIRAGDWWCSLEIKDDPAFKGMIKAVHGDDVGEDHIVFATTTDGIAGIFELGRVTSNKKYETLAISVSQWLFDNMYYPNEGVCYDFFDLKKREVLKANSPFHQGKLNQTLDDLARPNTEGSPFAGVYKLTGDKKFLDAHLLLCKTLVEKQDSNGLWMQYSPNFAQYSFFHPRFNLWYAESLLEAYDITKEKKYLDAAVKTARQFSKIQQKDGTIFYENFTNGMRSNNGSICGSATAFAGLLWMRLEGYGYPEFKVNYEKSAYWIMRNRYPNNYPNPNLRGAVFETQLRGKNGGIWLVHRDIGTSFGIRFLAGYYKLKYGK